MLVVGTLAFLLSVSTDAPLGAVGGAVLLHILSSILDQIEALGSIRSFLPTHFNDAWVGLLSTPVQTSAMDARRDRRHRIRVDLRRPRVLALPAQGHRLLTPAHQRLRGSVADGDRNGGAGALLPHAHVAVIASGGPPWNRPTPGP